MDAITLRTDLTPDEVSMWAGAMRHSEGWEKGYSLNSPRSTDDAVAMVQEARNVRLGICYVYGVPIDAHWLIHMHYREWAWVLGIVFPAFRGGDNTGLLMDTWNRFATWARKQGYPELLCASFVDNVKAHRWIVDVCGFYEVGVMDQGSPHASDGLRKPVKVFASDGHDEALARQRAETVYTQGDWIEYAKQKPGR